MVSKLIRVMEKLFIAYLICFLFSASMGLIFAGETKGSLSNEEVLEMIEKMKTEGTPHDSVGMFPHIGEIYKNEINLPDIVKEAIMDLYKSTSNMGLKKRIASDISLFLTDKEAEYFKDLLVNSPDTETQYQAALALRYWGGKDVFESVAKVLEESEEPILKKNLPEILGNSYDKDYIPLVKSILQKEKDEGVIVGALEALVKLEGNHAQELLLEYFNVNTHWRILSYLPILLEDCADERAIEPTIRLLENFESNEKELLEKRLNEGIDYDGDNFKSLSYGILEFVTMDDMPEKLEDWKKWYDENKDFDARKAQVAYLKDNLDGYLKAARENEFPEAGKWIPRIFQRAYYLGNFDVLPFIKQVLDEKLSPYNYKAYFHASMTAALWNYREGYEGLIEGALSSDLGSVGLFSSNLKILTGKYFDTKEEWLNWLEENKDKFKTIKTSEE